MCERREEAAGADNHMLSGSKGREYIVPELEEAYRDDNLRGMGYEPEC